MASSYALESDMHNQSKAFSHELDAVNEHSQHHYNLPMSSCTPSLRSALYEHFMNTQKAVIRCILTIIPHAFKAMPRVLLKPPLLPESQRQNPADM